MRKQKHTQLTLKCAALTVLAMFVFAQPEMAKASLFGDTEQAQSIDKTYARLSGFAPGASVSYTIITKDQVAVSASARIDQDGILSILLPSNFETQDSDISYDMSIDDGEKPLNVLLKLNAETGRMSVMGRGASPFSKIVIGDEADQAFETRSDWAGLFEETEIKSQTDNAEQSSYKVAFYNLNSASDASNRTSPAVIEVVSAPGGGGPTSTGVNTFTPVCTGTHTLSTCDGSSLANQTAAVVRNYVQPMQMMAEQLASVMMQQMGIIGTFFDAKDQMEGQRKHQELKARAVKDYHPSEQMCRIGSYMRSLAATESKAAHDKRAINDALMSHYTNHANNASSAGAEKDYATRLDQYKRVYCDPQDNAGALDLLCDHDGNPSTPSPNEVGATDNRRINKDIDFTRTVSSPYTLDIDFTDTVGSDDEADIIALARNLYWPSAFTLPEQIDQTSFAYQQARQLMALSSLAHNSFANLVAIKAKAADPVTGTAQPGWAHMKTMMREFGLSDTDIEELIGENPSYDAQMDVLTKKIYQNPDFYTNLYDKPVNVDRISAAMTAIQLMQLRDHYEASLRREMLASAMLEHELTLDAEKLQGRILDQQ